MPYGKRRHSSYGARRGFRKKRHHSSKAQIARVVQSILKVEKKHFTIGQVNASISAGWQNVDATVGLFDIQQGSGESQRIGSQIKITNVNWRWNLTNHIIPTSAVSEDVRLMIILDKQCNGASAATALIWSDDDYQGYNNIDNKRRFRTLYDSGTISLKKTGGAGDGTTNIFTSDVKNGAVYLKNLDIMIDFDASAAAITDLTSNNLIFAVASHTGGHAALDSLVRFRYTDV